MTLRELEKELNFLHELMDVSIDSVTDSATKAQEVIFKFLTEYLNNFEILDGRFVATQDYTSRFAYIQKKIESILGDLYTPSIKEYLSVYTPIEETSIRLHKEYNDLELDLEKVAPTRKVIYNEAKYFLTEAISSSYIQPVKYLLMQHVTRGITIRQSQRILNNWNKGEITGQLTSGRPTPRLQSYATQISRDSAYQFHGTIQEKVRKEYNLQAGIYTGDIIKDSRPSCVWAVRQKRKIKLTEITAILGGEIPKGGKEIMAEKNKPFLSGLIPGTNTENFGVYRFGFSCRHSWFPVKLRASDIIE